MTCEGTGWQKYTRVFDCEGFNEAGDENRGLQGSARACSWLYSWNALGWRESARFVFCFFFLRKVMVRMKEWMRRDFVLLPFFPSRQVWDAQSLSKSLMRTSSLGLSLLLFLLLLLLLLLRELKLWMAGCWWERPSVEERRREESGVRCGRTPRACAHECAA